MSMLIRFLCLTLVVSDPAAVATVPTPGKIDGHNIAVLAPYVVEGSYTKVVLKTGFRYHMIWSGVKSLTFKAVPPSWEKVGVKVGDHLIRIDGQLVDGLKVREFGRVLKKATQEPAATFEVQSRDSGVIITIQTKVKKGEEGELTITS